MAQILELKRDHFSSPFLIDANKIIDIICSSELPVEIQADDISKDYDAWIPCKASKGDIVIKVMTAFENAPNGVRFRIVNHALSNRKIF